MGAGRGPEAPEDSEAVDPAGAPDAGGEDLPTPSEVFRGSMAHTGDAYFRRLPLVIAILTLFVAGIVAQFVIDLRSGGPPAVPYWQLALVLLFFGSFWALTIWQFVQARRARRADEEPPPGRPLGSPVARGQWSVPMVLAAIMAVLLFTLPVIISATDGSPWYTPVIWSLVPLSVVAFWFIGWNIQRKRRRKGGRKDSGRKDSGRKD
nr:hypothetical protein [Actinomycetales bacterium]